MEYTLPSLPLLALDTEPPDFDYGAFLQGEDDAEYLAGDTSATDTSITLTDGTVQAVAPPPINTDIDRSKTQSPANSSGTPLSRQRLERRGHTKSRQGWFNCKRRRIKVLKDRCAARSRLLTRILTVPRNEACVRTLREIRPELWISCLASGKLPGSWKIPMAARPPLPTDVHPAATPDSAVQPPRHALLPALPPQRRALAPTRQQGRLGS